MTRNVGTSKLPSFEKSMIIFIITTISVFVVPESLPPPVSVSMKNLRNNRSLPQSSMNNDNHNKNSLFHLDLGQIFYSIEGISENCRTIAVYRERTCYGRHLDGIDKLVERQTITNDVRSDFERKVCCAIWDWYDCTSGVIRDECSDLDWDRYSKFPSGSGQSSERNLYREYCYGYEYNSGQCLLLPGWAYLLLSIGIIVVISFGCVGLVWYWRSGARQNIDYYRKRRPVAYRRPPQHV